MAKKNSNQAKVSKIKSTKINREDFKNSLHQQRDDYMKNINPEQTNYENEELVCEDNQKQETNNADSNLNQNNETVNSEQINNEQLNNNNQQVVNKEVVDKLINEIKELNNKNNNLQEEVNKLQQLLEEERKQLIVKLEEKSQTASKLIEEKKQELIKQNEIELQEAKDKIYIDVIANFLSPLILFEQTIRNTPENPVIRAYVQGYNMIASMFKDKLSNLHVEQIDVNVGDTFNENFMDAFDVEHVDGVEPNRVLKVVSEGYVYKKSKVIKFTSVVVSK